MHVKICILVDKRSKLQLSGLFHVKDHEGYCRDSHMYVVIHFCCTRLIRMYVCMYCMYVAQFIYLYTMYCIAGKFGGQKVWRIHSSIDMFGKWHIIFTSWYAATSHMHIRSYHNGKSSDR